MSQSYYIAFVVDHDIAERGTVIVEAGVDLLAGPYPSEDAAARALRDTCVQHRRLAAFAGLAQFLCRDTATPPVRIEVISVSIARLARYNARHLKQAQGWPLRLALPTITNKPVATPKVKFGTEAKRARRAASK